MHTSVTAKTLESDEVRLSIEHDEEENIHSASVMLYSLGYSIGFRCEGDGWARILFEALQHVKEISAD